MKLTVHIIATKTHSWMRVSEQTVGRVGFKPSDPESRRGWVCFYLTPKDAKGFLKTYKEHAGDNSLILKTEPSDEYWNCILWEPKINVR